ncbi:MAG: hypothetical protein GY918_07465, partial [Gammaproteobacteria bacterium]|nr:hypothetical protein [Gammaproteobacteria bacterium]
MNNLVVYAYTYPHFIEAAKKSGMLEVKVGDTTQGLAEGLSPQECADIRMKQQAAEEAHAKIVVGTWLVSKDKIKRDKDLHRIFKLEGRRPAELNGKGTEWFYFNQNPGVANKEISKVIESFGQTARPKIVLREEQERTLNEAVRIALDTDSNRVDIAANLPPRFGKTIWALMLFRRFARSLNHDTMILPASWLSSQTSFKQEIKTFREFKDMVFIDTRLDGWVTEMNDAYAASKKVVVAVSLYTTNKYKLKPLRDI